MTVDLAQFHQVFFEESFEGVAVMESGLLDLDPAAVDSEQINAIFRAAHSIKGGSGTFGFDAIADFTHVMESLLDEIREGQRPLTAELRELLLRSVDLLRDMLSAASGEGSSDDELVKSLRLELEAILDNQQQVPEQEDLGRLPAVAEQDGVIGWHLVFSPLPYMMRTGNDPLRILRELAELGELDIRGDVSLLPGFEQFDPEECHLSWDIRLHSAVELAQINEIFDWVEEECDLAIIPLHQEASASVAEDSDPAPGHPDGVEKEIDDSLPERRNGGERRLSDRRLGDRRVASAPGQSGSIRVDTHKIDHLINLVGELVITQSMLSMLGDNFRPHQLDRLKGGLEELERHTRELQESVMQIRMLPISFTFSRFPRLVHDLSREMGKKIELKMTGENTELDKTVIEKIGDPLVHLVRNSLDHGIEPPAERVAAGKPEIGTLELKAFHRNGNIVIEIRDDGRGLDPERILKKAIEKGVVDKQESLSDRQILELVFQAGFSTVDEVSDLSGRGVGMDVVRKNVNELGGSIELESEPGKGSAVVISLPLTLAILDGQCVAIGDEVYIVPLLSIVESVQVTSDMVNRIAGQGETFLLREEYLQVIRLHEVLSVKDYKAKALTDGLLVVVEGEGRRCGLLVDDLIGQQQVVIKPLEANYRRVDGISGATIMGDGSVALILDIPGIMRLANHLPPVGLLQWSA